MYEHRTGDALRPPPTWRFVSGQGWFQWCGHCHRWLPGDVYFGEGSGNAEADANHDKAVRDLMAPPGDPFAPPATTLHPAGSIENPREPGMPVWVSVTLAGLLTVIVVGGFVYTAGGLSRGRRGRNRP